MREHVLQTVSVVLAASLCASCCTQALWKKTNPRERVWISSSQVTQAELDRKGVKYERYQGTLGDGYLVEKGAMRTFRDYTFRTFGTPITITIDAVTAVPVVGVLILNDMMKDPDFW